MPADDSQPLPRGANGLKVYLSYAWKDGTPDGIRRGKLADDLCKAMASKGIRIRRDKDQIKPGERISTFMKELAQGDQVIVVLSDHYLKSEFCMYELYEIWKSSGQNQDEFIHRVIPLILPDAKLDKRRDRASRVSYWRKEMQALEAEIDPADGHIVDPAVAEDYAFLKCLADHAGVLINLLADKCSPRDFERQAAEGFTEVLAQINAAAAKSSPAKYMDAWVQSEYLPPRLQRLSSLAQAYPGLDGDALRQALQRALRRRYPSSTLSLSQQFGDLDQLQGWQDLIAAAQQGNNQQLSILDDQFLEGLGIELGSLSQSDPLSAVSSLLLMVLDTQAMDGVAQNSAYEFRSYFSRPGDTGDDYRSLHRPEECKTVSRGQRWADDLQALILEAIKLARRDYNLMASDRLLLEIFLPAQLLSQPIGQLIKFSQPQGGSKRLDRQYRYVLRSSERFLLFRENEQDHGLPNHLPLKWDRAAQANAAAATGPSCFWWHDQSSSSAAMGGNGQQKLEDAFTRFGSRAEWFAIKRVEPLPQQADSWLWQVLLNCPAVAIWWRPKPLPSKQALAKQLTRKQCLESFQFCCSPRLAQPFGAAAPDHPGVDPLDSFIHPTRDHLGLFYELAEASFQGRLDPTHGQAFDGMVLLVDSHDRWPLPLKTARLSEAGDVLNAPEEDILISFA